MRLLLPPELLTGHDVLAACSKTHDIIAQVKHACVAIMRPRVTRPVAGAHHTTVVVTGAYDLFIDIKSKGRCCGIDANITG